MNIQKIREIINSNISDEHKSILVTQVIADDEKAINIVLNILAAERVKKRNLINESNAELSRALVLLHDKNLRFNKKVIVNPKWVITQIKNHYIKWKDYISCNFNIDGL